jgi:hypothetical protein
MFRVKRRVSHDPTQKTGSPNPVPTTLRPRAATFNGRNSGTVRILYGSNVNRPVQEKDVDVRAGSLQGANIGLDVNTGLVQEKDVRLDVSAGSVQADVGLDVNTGLVQEADVGLDVSAGSVSQSHGGKVWSRRTVWIH